MELDAFYIYIYSVFFLETDPSNRMDGAGNVRQTKSIFCAFCLLCCELNILLTITVIYIHFMKNESK